jgi:predicted O-methyltransferase YrrM
MDYERQLGPLTDCHNEWSVIADLVDERQHADPRLLELAAAAVQATIAVPSSFLAERADDPIVGTWPGEHYRLLPGLCEAFAAHQVVEIGTWRGESALAFLHAESVARVDTFDLMPWTEVPHTVLRHADFGDRLEQHLADLVVEWDTYRSLLREADLVFVDGPKDGRWEPEFFDLLLAEPPAQRQLVVIDDTRVMSMVRLWRALPAPKLDLTSFGHFSGTGVLLRDPA